MRVSSRSQAIITTRHEINKSAVSQILQLLAYLRLDVLVAGIEIAEMPFEGVDLVKGEIAFAKGLHALHDVEQPTARFRRLVSEEERLLPFCEDDFLGADEAVLHDMNLARLWDAAEQDIRPDPASAPRSERQRFSFLDDLADKKVFRNDEQINDCKRLEIVVHQKQVWIVARSQTLAFRLERAVDNPRSEFALLALQFELFAAGGTEEIRQWTVVREGRNLRIAAVRAIGPCADPGFRPSASALRAAGVGRIGILRSRVSCFLSWSQYRYKFISLRAVRIAILFLFVDQTNN
jgi:hypothetical protein